MSESEKEIGLLTHRLNEVENHRKELSERLVAITALAKEKLLMWQEQPKIAYKLFKKAENRAAKELRMANESAWGAVLAALEEPYCNSPESVKSSECPDDIEKFKSWRKAKFDVWSAVNYADGKIPFNPRVLDDPSWDIFERGLREIESDALKAILPKMLGESEMEAKGKELWIAFLEANGEAPREPGELDD